MKKRVIVTFMLALVVALPCFAMAAEQDEPAVYVIKRGDTLWGLSERFIKDPYYWPDMWSSNDQITNPHFIYPGQKVRVFQDHLEFVPREQPLVAGAQKAVAAKADDIRQSVAEEKRIPVRGSEGFLKENGEKPFGMVVGVHHDRIVAGTEDIVYTDIGTNHGAKSGDRFSIFREEGMVSHPASSEIMGRKMIPLGTLQLTDLEVKASRGIITRNFKEITVGSILVPYRDVSKEVSLKKATRELKGYIIESNSGTQILSAGDIVYVDLGRIQGAEPGNLLYIVRDVVIDRKYSEGRVDKIPQELLGAVVILETGRKTATALIVKSIDTIYVGDKLISQTK